MSSLPRVLGIDPGLHGALVLINSEARKLACAAMPTRKEKRSGGKYKTFVDEDRLLQLIRLWDPDISWLEDVFSKRGDGHVGAFSFGEGKGILKGVLAGCGVPRRYVSPQKWKADLHVSTEPELITARCNELFPGCERLLKSEGKREAAMIALWACLSGLGLQLYPLLPDFLNGLG